MELFIPFAYLIDSVVEDLEENGRCSEFLSSIELSVRDVSTILKRETHETVVVAEETSEDVEISRRETVRLNINAPFRGVEVEE